MTESHVSGTSLKKLILMILLKFKKNIFPKILMIVNLLKCSNLRDLKYNFYITVLIDN